MKFDISSEPKFEWTPTLEQLDVLLKLSSMHYDSTCRQASLPGSIANGSFIYAWKNIVKSYDGEIPTDYKIICSTWHQLDICMKIMECNIGLSDQEKTIIDEVRVGFGYAMNSYREKSRHWRYELNTGADVAPEEG